MQLSPLNYAPGFWIDASDLSTLKSDTARTTAATNGGAVKGLLDKSGNTHYLTESTNAPTRSDASINGLTSLAFNGSQILTSHDAVLGTGDSISYCNMVVSSGGSSAMNVIFSDAGAYYYYYRNLADGSCNFHLNGVSSYGAGFAGGNTTNETHVDLMAYNGSKMFAATLTATRRLFGNIQTNSGFALARTGTTNNGGGGGGVTIGQIGYGGLGLTGNVGEIVSTNRCWDLNEIRWMLDYAVSKWIVSPANYLVCMGDSITEGTDNTAGQEYPTLLGALLGGTYLVERDSYAGRYLINPTGITSGMREMYQSLEWRLLPSCHSRMGVLVFFGANDLSAYTDAQFRLIYAETARRIIQMGAYPIAATVIARGDGAGAAVNAARATFNPYLLANYQAMGYAGVVDFAGNAAFAADAAANDTTYYNVDKVHPNDTGAGVLAAVAAAAVPGILTPKYYGSLTTQTPPIDLSATAQVAADKSTVAGLLETAKTSLYPNTATAALNTWTGVAKTFDLRASNIGGRSIVGGSVNITATNLPLNQISDDLTGTGEPDQGGIIFDPANP